MASDEKPSAQQNEAVLFVQTVLQTIDAHGSSLQMVLGATLVVSLGAFGSLVRPPSAAPPKERRLLDRRKRRKTGGKTSTLSEGLLPSDALLFPVMAGTVLVALYYAIQYLRDPDLLGKIVRAYAALMSMLSLSRLAADVFELATQLVFPTYWRGGDGRVFVVLWERRVVGEQQTVWLRSEKEGDAKESYVVVRQVSGRRGTTPLPGILGSIPLPQRVVGALWKVRLLLREDWDVEFKLLGGVVDVDTSFRVKDVVGKVAAAAAAVWYYWTESVIVSNLMGVSFCYGAMLTVSPTTFITAVCVLCGLFVYDVVMVFYT